MTPCPSADVWRAALAQQLNADQDQAYTRHAETCPQCQHLLEGLVGAEARSSRLLAQAAAALDTPHGGVQDTPHGWVQDTGAWSFAPGLYDAVAPTRLPVDTPVPQVPGYEILQELGRGGMGVVYLARHSQLNRLVALKMVLSGQFASAEDLARFRAEAEAVAQLQHPHIVQIHEIGTLEGLPFFSLEYVSGGSLHQRLQGQPLPARIVAEVLQPIAAAVHAAHQKGILHRDLKPANILLADKETRRQGDKEKEVGSVSLSAATPKLTDFGLAKRYDQQNGATQTGVIMGTPDYMAPEQARGQKHLGPAADIFALGTILYEMLTGRPPFRGAEPLETIQRVVTEDPVPPSRLMPSLPRDLETICLKCLQKEPSRRYLTAQELADDLQRFRSGEPIRARPVGSMERAVKWAKRKPAFAGLLATVVLAVAALSVAVAMLWQANQVETTLREQAQTNEGKAQTNERKAVRYQQKADQAVNDLFVAVTEHDQLRPAAMREVRLLLLEKALPYFQAFRQERGDDPALIVETAANQRRIALIFNEKGEWAKACRAYEEALPLWEKAVAAQPDVLQPHLQLAKVRRDLGDVQVRLARYADAEQNLRQAVALLKKLAAANPANDSVPFELAFAQTSLATLLGGQEHFQEALKLHQKLVDQNPHKPANRFNLATTWAEFATWQVSQGQREAADKSYGEAIRVQERLVADHPEQADHRHHLATMLANRGTLAMETKRLTVASDNLERAVKLYSRLTEQFPTVVSYRHDEALAYNSMGNMHSARGQSVEAVANYDKAQARLAKLAQDHPTVPDYQVDLGPILINRGVVAFRTGQPQAALSWFEQAIDRLAPVLARWPGHSKARRHLREAWKSRAAVLDLLGKHGEAAQAWEQAIAHDDQNLALLRTARIKALARAGATSPQELPAQAPR